MHKFVRALVPAIVATVSLTACGGGNDNATDAGKKTAEDATTSAAASPSESAAAIPDRGDADLVIWTDGGQPKYEAMKKVGEAFAQAQGIKVAVQQVATDLQANFVTADAAGNGPDVVVGAHDWIGNLVQNGSIEPLQLSADQVKAYSEKAVSASTYNGQLYGLPYGMETLALFRNTALAPTKPATLDDAVEEGLAAVKAGKAESALNVPVGDQGDAYHMEPLFTSMGGYLFGTKVDGSYDPADMGVGKPGSLKAAEKVAQLGKQKVLRTSISGDNSISLFTSGKAAFLVSGPWALADVKKSGVKYDVQPIPGFAGEKPAAPFMGAQEVMIAQHAKNEAFAQEFVGNFLNTPEQMKTVYELSQEPPSMLSLQKSVDKDAAVFAQAANVAQPMPAIPEMQSVWEPLGKAYAAIVRGAEPRSTMSKAGQTIAAAIKSAGH